MLVVGATYPEELADIRSRVGDLPFLVPGVGAQGGDVAKVMAAGKTARRHRARDQLVARDSLRELRRRFRERRAQGRAGTARLDQRAPVDGDIPICGTTGMSPFTDPSGISRGGTTSGGPGGRRAEIRHDSRQACSGCASIQNGVTMPTGTGCSDFIGSSSRSAFDHDGVLVGVRRAKRGAIFVRHHVLANVADAQIERGARAVAAAGVCAGLSADRWRRRVGSLHGRAEDQRNSDCLPRE